jgi:hypothetical protein
VFLADFNWVERPSLPVCDAQEKGLLEMHDLRFKGELLGRFASEEEAELHRDKHLSLHMAHEKLAPHVTVTPSGPIEVWCHGNFVDSFANTEMAQAFVDERIRLAKDQYPAMMQDDFGYELVDVRLPPPGDLRYSFAIAPDGRRLSSGES